MRGLIIASILLVGAKTATAGSPLFTEDASVLAAKTCEAEAYLAKAMPGASHAGGAQFGCGVGAGSQLALAVGRDSAWGTNQAGVLGKTALLALSETQPGLAVAYAASFQKSPTADARYEAAEAKLALTIQEQQWLLHANAGWARARSEAADVVTWNFAAERLGARDRLDLMAEVFGDSRHAPWLRLAARWALVPERIFFNLSWGVQASGNKDKLIVSGLHVSF